MIRKHKNPNPDTARANPTFGLCTYDLLQDAVQKRKGYKFSLCNVFFQNHSCPQSSIFICASDKKIKIFKKQKPTFNNESELRL